MCSYKCVYIHEAEGVESLDTDPDFAGLSALEARGYPSESEERASE
jgi:hypothetical protein